MEIERENEKFIALIEQYKIIMDKSQNSAIKEAKQVAISELIVKWAAISGKTLTQKSILKKLSNLKVRTKAVDGKKQPLCNWQTKLLTIMTVSCFMYINVISAPILFVLIFQHFTF